MTNLNINTLKTRLKDTKIWQRALFMVLLTIFAMMTQAILWVAIMALFLIRLISGEIPNAFIKGADSLSWYIYQIYRYLTFNTEKQPFPFSSWPSAKEDQKKHTTTVTHPNDESISPPKTPELNDKNQENT